VTGRVTVDNFYIWLDDMAPVQKKNHDKHRVEKPGTGNACPPVGLYVFGNN
jgi:hypothetical protein